MQSLLAGLRRRLTEVPTLAGHSYRVAHISEFMARRLGWRPKAASNLREASELHDIGKIKIPLAVLMKPTVLTPEERALVLNHSLIGRDHLLDQREAPIFELAAQVAAEHHEYFDGSGYPLRLRGNAISEAGRIAACADVYDALRSPRVYKMGFNHEEALEIMLKGDGRTWPDQFDPRLIDVLRRDGDRLAKLYRSFPFV
jgi:putative two-component system response regulator